jgi:hypothetical protein
MVEQSLIALRLTLTQDGVPAADRAGLEAGWNAMFDQLVCILTI